MSQCIAFLPYLGAMCRFHFDVDVDLEGIVQSFPSYVSGADVSAVCSGAMMTAIHRRIQDLVTGKADWRWEVVGVGGGGIGTD